jgi:molybdenum cofactor cytidylyltransferase
MKNKNKTDSWGIVLLAAGTSSRLGKPKQLLSFNGSTLLRNAARAAISSEADSIAIVLGADAINNEDEVKDLPVDIVINKEYEKGMASSIVTGLHFLIKKYPALDGIVMMLCDQPFADAGHIRKLVDMHHTSGCPIVTSFYEGRKGVPAYFHKELFSELLQLKGDRGARDIIMKHGNESASVPFPLGAIDIDTPEEYEALIKSVEKGA